MAERDAAADSRQERALEPKLEPEPEPEPEAEAACVICGAAAPPPGEPCAQCGAPSAVRALTRRLRAAPPWRAGARLLVIPPVPWIRAVLEDEASGPALRPDVTALCAHDDPDAALQDGSALRVDPGDTPLRDGWFDGAVTAPPPRGLAGSELRRLMRPGAAVFVLGGGALVLARAAGFGAQDGGDGVQALRAPGPALDPAEPPPADSRGRLQIAAHRHAPEDLALAPAPMARPALGPRALSPAMAIANAYGWEWSNAAGFEAVWDGGAGPDALAIRSLSAAAAPPPHAVSHYGGGVLTIVTSGFVVTSLGWDLWVMGPINRPKPGASPLAALVEADWSRHPLTMNWRLTDPGRAVRFAAGEPIAALFPVQRGALERFEPRDVRSSEAAPRWRAAEQAAAPSEARGYGRGPAAPVSPPPRRGLSSPPFRRG